MIKRTLRIGEWVVDLLVCERRYDAEGVCACLRDASAPLGVIGKVEAFMSSYEVNKGIVYPNPSLHRAVLLVGPTTSLSEFLDTLTRLMQELVVWI